MPQVQQPPIEVEVLPEHTSGFPHPKAECHAQEKYAFERMPADQPQECQRLLRTVCDLLQRPLPLGRGSECDDVPTNLVLGGRGLEGFVQHSAVRANHRRRESFVQLLLMRSSMSMRLLSPTNCTSGNSYESKRSSVQLLLP